MTSTPDDLFNDLDDPAKAKEFLNSVSGGTVELARARIRSELYLAHKTKAAGDTLAEALHEAAKSSEKYARGLNYATWALVLATLVLAIIQVITIFKS